MTGKSLKERPLLVLTWRAGTPACGATEMTSLHLVGHRGVRPCRLFEKDADLLVGRLGKVIVPDADRVERLGRAGADGLVSLLLEVGAGFRGADRHRHDEPRGLLPAQGGHRGA